MIVVPEMSRLRRFLNRAMARANALVSPICAPGRSSVSRGGVSSPAGSSRIAMSEERKELASMLWGRVSDRRYVNISWTD